MGVNKVVVAGTTKLDLTEDTVTSDKLASGVTAHDKSGESIVGTIEEGVPSWSSSSVEYNTSTYLNTIRTICVAKNDVIVRAESEVMISVPAENFGDAAAADVAAGKTFTSDAGLKIVGTAASSGSGGNLPATITAGDTPIMASMSGKKISSTTVTNTGLSLTMSKAGTYRFRVSAAVVSSYGSGSPTVYLYKNGSQVSSKTVSSSTVNPVSFDLECAAGDVIAVWAAGAGSSYSTTAVIVLSLVACIEWNNGF